jgi:glycosyltransferase involved in cell wall biosynthesis
VTGVRVTATQVMGVHVVVPAGVDDPTKPSGGNVFDRHACDGLVGLGWSVREHAVAGPWPQPTLAARAALGRAVSAIPDEALVLVDGLVASSVPDVLVPHARRLDLVVLVHMPLGEAGTGDDAARVRRREATVLSAAAAVVTPSRWTRQWLLDAYSLAPDRVHVVEPGVDDADLAPGTIDGGALLCVGAVAPHKGHDVLLAALGLVGDLPWRCVCVGALDIDPVFVERRSEQARRDGVAERVSFAGPRTGEDLAVSYAAADLLVLASTAEAYGMVVTEALARGIPVVGSRVGGVPEALGRTADGSMPGLLVPPGDPQALAAALRCWLVDDQLRRRLRESARQRRTTLTSWSATATRLSDVLQSVSR